MDDVATEFETLEEVALRLRQSVHTLRYWRQQGIGPKSARFGRRVMYKRADVDAWVEAQFEEEPA